jgi:hypothetical protein
VVPQGPTEAGEPHEAEAARPESTVSGFLFYSGVSSRVQIHHCVPLCDLLSNVLYINVDFPTRVYNGKSYNTTTVRLEIKIFDNMIHEMK